VLLGGQFNESTGLQTSLVDLNDPSVLVKSIPIKSPLKWSVTNYEWDASLMYHGGGISERYLQTVWWFCSFI
jgi:hypothetical protein